MLCIVVFLWLAVASNKNGSAGDAADTPVPLSGKRNHPDRYYFVLVSKFNIKLLPIGVKNLKKYPAAADGVRTKRREEFLTAVG